MSNLYNVADSNIRRTYSLITIFLILVILFGLLISYALDSIIILFIAIIYALVSVIASYWWSDKIILNMFNAKKIQKEDNPELFRLVENLCITAGLPMPKIYILNEKQPNAFATGRNPDNAVIAFTTGLLEKLERTELEGVIAHELSHIKNRDILIGSVVVVLVAVIAVLARLYIRTSLWGGRGRGRGNEIFVLLGILAAIILPFVATIIRLAISRKREFLADASAALLTRYPEGLAKALEKISSDPNPMKQANEQTASHLFISSPLKGQEKVTWFSKLFMTHPPVKERIAALKGYK
jgi:heat shock protein HtpX